MHSPLPENDVLVLRHVPWEGLGAFAQLLEQRRRHWRYVDVFAGMPIPDLRTARALFVMGGPMGVYDTNEHPFLVDEIEAIRSAVLAGVPTLGVCLGSQLLAAALGASVGPNPAGKEIGWGVVHRAPGAADDALFTAFRPVETVLHWHGDVFDLPSGAVSLGSSPMTAHQAFRWGKRAWGLLFHVEADLSLVHAWLREPSMWAEAAEIDPGLPERIREETPRHQEALSHLRASVVEAVLEPV